MEHIQRVIVSYVIPVVEACGAIVIVLEVLRTFVRYVIHFLQRKKVDVRALRHRLGQAMVTGLEFQVAADILRTATAPTWNDILLLAALIALRTVLNFLLEQELKTLGAEKTETDS
jgi:uncharacterized membrane protein